MSLLLPLCPQALGEAKIKVAEQSFDFKTVRWDEPVEHTFHIENVGQETVELETVQVTAPLFFKNVRKRIPPGERADINIILRTPRPPGAYEGAVQVLFKNPELTNLVFEVTGTIIPPIEILPHPVFFVSAFRNETKEASLTIVNREERPLEIPRIKNDSSRFTLELKSIEPGRKYSLMLKLKGVGKAGKVTDPIYLFTSSDQKPVLIIQANTFIKERVHTFPDTLDFGRLRLADLKAHPELSEQLAQRLMVYQNQGTDFKIKPTCDVPFLNMLAEPSKAGDRYEIKVDFDSENVTAGPLNSVIKIQTNDREFPSINVPVTGVIVSD